jgi:hypothetical protein
MNEHEQFVLLLGQHGRSGNLQANKGETPRIVLL